MYITRSPAGVLVMGRETDKGLGYSRIIILIANEAMDNLAHINT